MRVVRGWLPWALWFAAGCSAQAPVESADARPAGAARQALSATASAGPPRISRQELLDKLRARLSRPPGELRVQRRQDGSQRIALDGHLQHATIAVVGPDGAVHTSCVDNPRAAARALGLPPEAAQ